MIRRLLDVLYDAAGWLAAAFVLALFVVMIGQSILREFGVATGPVNDVVAWSCAAAAFLAMAHTFRHGDFVRMTLVIEAASPRLRRPMEILAIMAGLIGTGYAAYWVVRSVFDSWRYQEMTTGLLVLPLWIPQIAFALGAILLFVALLDELVCVVRGATPSYVAAVEERRARGDYSEEL